MVTHDHGVPLLPAPPVHDDGRADTDGVVAWVARHLGHLTLEGPEGVRPSRIRGGQRAADAALGSLDVTGYAARRSVVAPVGRRGASVLSPYIRHGLLPLPQVWTAVAGAPARDRGKFRDELMWQEYARHVYARVGRANAASLRFEPPRPPEHDGPGRWHDDPWPAGMACMEASTTELHEDGWLVNQVRMWMASQWAVRAGLDWRAGEREMYRHLLDGSAAANRLGWQWTTGQGTGKVYGFSRWQVEKRAPGLCARCRLRDDCPIQDWPDAGPGPKVGPDGGPGGGPGADLGPGQTPAGPRQAEITGEPDAVWLTAESLGATDPAVTAHPGVPRVFVFDEPLLARLRLSGKRLVFLGEALAELAGSGATEVRLGDPVDELAGRPLAATWNFTPGFARRSADLDVVGLHPWPWLRRPGSGPLRSFSAWSRALR